ncbi:MAG: GFA family protein, partial [Myxococcales bacterium]|nr:GFA family protein [Myxococcales bacterium]
LFIDYDSEPDQIGYTPGTVDGHPGHTTAKERHIFVSSKVPWYEIENHRPQLDED